MRTPINLRAYGTDRLDVDFTTVRRMGDIDSSVEEWSVEVRAEDEMGIPVSLARASVHLIPHALFHDDVHELLRASHPDLETLASDLAGRGRDIPCSLFGEGTGLLVVRSVGVEPAYRGNKLGHLIVSAAQSFLLRDGHGLTVLNNRHPEDSGAEPAAKLEAYWSRARFLPYRGFLVHTV